MIMVGRRDRGSPRDVDSPQVVVLKKVIGKSPKKKVSSKKAGKKKVVKED